MDNFHNLEEQLFKSSIFFRELYMPSSTKIIIGFPMRCCPKQNCRINGVLKKRDNEGDGTVFKK